jgi:hypothetical protein
MTLRVAANKDITKVSFQMWILNFSTLISIQLNSQYICHCLGSQIVEYLTHIPKMEVSNPNPGIRIHKRAKKC